MPTYFIVFLLSLWLQIHVKTYGLQHFKYECKTIILEEIKHESVEFPATGLFSEVMKLFSKMCFLYSKRNEMYINDVSTENYKSNVMSKGKTT